MIIFLVGGFKSSSLHLNSKLEKSLGLTATTFKSGSGIGHLNIKIGTKKLIKLKLLNSLNKNILVFQHLFPTKHNIEILDASFGLNNVKFIITYRNVFDSLKSIINEKKKTNTFNLLRSKFYPTYQNFNSKKYDINILDALFVVNFYAMWFKIEKEKYIKNIEFVGFNEITKNISDANKKLSSFLNINLKLEPNIKTNLFNSENFELSRDLKELIIDYANSFEDIDFSRVGL